MKYVHLFEGTEHEAPEGALNWPWIPEDRIDEAEARARARGYVADQLEGVIEGEPAKRGPGRPRKVGGSPDA